MQIIYKNVKEGDFKLKVTSLDDLWHLSQTIDEGDIVSGTTLRKIKVSGESEKAASNKRPVHLSIVVERIEFSKYSDNLRVLGTVTLGPEDVPKGSHHTIEIESGTTFTIHKDKWLKYQLDRIDEAVNEKPSKSMIIVLERDSAGFALLKHYGYDFLGEITGDVEKKEYEKKQPQKEFYSLAADELLAYVKRYSIENLIIASPAFWKEDFLKVLSKKDQKLAKSAILATCNDTGKNGVDEVLKRPEVKSVMAKERASKEIELVEKMLYEISKDGLASYGYSEVKKAAELKAIKTLLVLDNFLMESRQSGNYKEVDELMRAIDLSGGEIVIVSSEHEGGIKLKGLGGIAALLRYKPA